MRSFVSSEVNLIEVIMQAQLAQSKREARDFIKSGAVYINGEKVILGDSDISSLSLQDNDFKFNQFVVLQRGKREFRLLKKL